MVRTKLTPEGKVKAEIKKALDAEGIFHFSAVMGLGKAGIPDIVCSFNGAFLGIEVKATAKDKVTALQLRRTQEIRAAGGQVFLIHEENLEAFKKFLKDFLKLTKLQGQKRMIPLLCPDIK